jgi:predicted RND superfamily exporter protein
LQLETVFDFRDFIPEGTDTHETVIFMLDNFDYGDEEYGQFYVKGDVTQPEVLRAIDEAIDNTADDKRVAPGVQPRSILALFEKYSNPISAQETNVTFLQTWAISDTNGDGIPESNVKDLIDILYDWPTSHDELIGVVYRTDTGAYDATLVQIRVSSGNLKKADILQAELEKDAKPLYDLEKDGVIDEAWVLGGPIVTNVVITELNEGQMNSIIITVIASFIVLTIIFFALERSVILGLLTTIPVTIVILWILGSMLFFGYDLNVMTITIASLTVGMGITYSIHITERFVEDLKIFKTPGQACKNTLTHTGMALAGAFATTAGGFGILFFHRLPPLQQFGVLIALSITYSFLASAYILPTFLIMWAKWKMKREGKLPSKKKVKKKPISKELAHKKRMPKGSRKPKKKKKKRKT